MLKYLRNNFPQIPIVWIIRHPLATCLSQDQGFGDPALDDIVFNQPALVDNHLRHLQTTIRSARSVFEQRLVRWCIQHIVPLRELDPDDVCIVFYEHLVSTPEQELKRIFDYVGREMTEDLWNVIYRPSLMARDARQAIPDRVERWRYQVTSEELTYYFSFVESFGLADIWMNDPKGEYGRLFKLLGTRGASSAPSP
jgi:hypothetical protein